MWKEISGTTIVVIHDAIIEKMVVIIMTIKTVIMIMRIVIIIIAIIT